MAKKQLKEDLFAGGSISDGDKKNKFAEAKAEAEKKVAQKNAEKKAQLDKELKDLKSKLATETDEAKKAELKKQISKVKIKMDNIGKGVSTTKSQKKIIQTVVAVVLIVAILVTYVCTGVVRKGFVHSTLQWTTHLTAVTVKSEDGDKMNIPVSTYNYYYATTYNNLQQTKALYEQYGLDASTAGIDVDFDKPFSKQKTTNEDDEVITWEQHLQELVVKSIEDTYSYYNEAVKENNGEEPEITEEQQKQLDETLDKYKETANKYGFTLSAYLVKAMGKGVTEKVFREESKISYIAQNFTKKLEDSLTEKEYTKEDFAKYRDENLEDLKSVDVRIFEADSEDEAVEFKKALEANGSNFTNLCVKHSKAGYQQDYYKDAGASTQLSVTKAVLKNAGYAIATPKDAKAKDEDKTYPGLDWLFSADRKAGDINQYSTTVVYVVAPTHLSDIQTVNVRHILISPITDEKSSTKPVDATDEQWSEAYKKANDILNEYNKGAKTAESFGELAKKNSSDGSASKGGLYENVYPNQMVDTFNAWCFDAARKTGDVGIVKTEFGYHIMYFVGTTGTTVWENTAQKELANLDTKSKSEEIDEKYTAKVNWFGSRYFEKDVDIDR